jgi:hypothetical protein
MPKLIPNKGLYSDEERETSPVFGCILRPRLSTEKLRSHSSTCQGIARRGKTNYPFVETLGACLELVLLFAVQKIPIWVSTDSSYRPPIELGRLATWMSASAHSRMMLCAYPRETQEMVTDAHERAFAFFRAPVRGA